MMQKGSDIMQENGSSLLELKNREGLNVSGVQNVDVFEEEKIILRTEQGMLEIQGAELNITHLDLETGSLQIAGVIDAVTYPKEKQKRQTRNRPKQSFFHKMLS